MASGIEAREGSTMRRRGGDRRRKPRSRKGDRAPGGSMAPVNKPRHLVHTLRGGEPLTPTGLGEIRRQDQEKMPHCVQSHLSLWTMGSCLSWAWAAHPEVPLEAVLGGGVGSEAGQAGGSGVSSL